MEVPAQPFVAVLRHYVSNAPVRLIHNAGHNIYAYSPALVIGAVHAVVDAVRNGPVRVD